MNDLRSGQIPMMFDSRPTVLPHLHAGTLRALAVTSLARAPSAPEVPTMDEAGLRGFEATAWFGLYGPGGMPAPLADALNAEAVTALGEGGMRERLARQGAEPGQMDRAAFTAFVVAETRKWAVVVERAQVRLD